MTASENYMHILKQVTADGLKCVTSVLNQRYDPHKTMNSVSKNMHTITLFSNTYCYHSPDSQQLPILRTQGAMQ